MNEQDYANGEGIYDTEAHFKELNDTVESLTAENVRLKGYADHKIGCGARAVNLCFTGICGCKLDNLLTPPKQPKELK